MSHLKTQKIDLSQKKGITGLYRKYGRGDSAHSFESIYMWREDMDLRIYLTPDLYAVSESTWAENTWFFPVGTKEARIRFIEEVSKDSCPTFSYITEKDRLFLEKNFKGQFNIWPEPADSEYIISRETMAELPGSSFSKSRGYIRKLLSTHNMETVSLRDISIEEILSITKIWESHKQEYTNIIDGDATLTALTNMDDLSLSGVVLLMDGTPCAVAAGFPLSKDTVDCCIQKATSGMQGLTYYLRQEYAKSHPENILFFNWEEDLGLEGLRKAKQLMRPCSMIDMFTGRKV